MLDRSIFVVRSSEVGWAEVRAAIASLKEARFLGEATDASDAMARLSALTRPPHLILTAAYVAGSPVVTMLRTLRNGPCPSTRFVIFGEEFEAKVLLAFAAIGDVSCLQWRDLCCESLPHFLASLVASDVILNSRSTVSALTNVLRGSRCGNSQEAQLSERERVILQQLMQGLTREQIARSEFMSVRTVNRIISGLEIKLDASNLFVLGAKAALIGI